MGIGSTTPPQHLNPAKACFINDVRTLVAKQLRVDVEFVTSETHFTNHLGADLVDRVELMLAIEDRFAGVEITDDDVERIRSRPSPEHQDERHIAVAQAGVRNGTEEKIQRCKRGDVRGAKSEH